jgi:hypothetical protein
MREQQSLREKEIARQLSHRGSNKEIWSRGNMFSRLNKVCGAAMATRWRQSVPRFKGPEERREREQAKAQHSQLTDKIL